MKFELCDKVIVKKTKKTGTITDILVSSANKTELYCVTSDNGSWSFYAQENELELIEPDSYFIKTDIADNVVVVIIYSERNGVQTEVCRGHGHIIHEGAVGIAQACAYAARRAFLSIDNGIFFKQNRQ